MANANGVPISNNGVDGTRGASAVALRGFDPSATLTLIDGRRVAVYPIGGGADATHSFVDLNTIPRAAIESIEVLKDGASTIYGADAVAGVVNIKFRHNYRGAEAVVEYGNTLDKDSGESSASLIFGAGDDKTQVTGAFNYYRRNSIFAQDRGNARRGLSTFSSPYNLQLSRDAVVAAIQADTTVTPDQRTALIANLPQQNGQPLSIFYGHAPFGTNGTAPVSQFVFSRRPTSFFDFNRAAGWFPNTERYGGFFNIEQKVCGDQLVLYSDLFRQEVKVHTELAPVAALFQFTGSTPVAVPPQHPVEAINPATGQPYGISGGPTAVEIAAPAGAFNPFNPFQQFISGFTLARLAEFGNRLFDNQTEAFMTTIGVKGDKLFDGNWGYDTGFRYSQIRNISQGSNVSGVLFNRILNANDPIFDPSSNQFIGTTTPFNPFTDYRVPFPSNQDTINFATVHPKDIDTSKLATLDASIYTTALFKLPAGGVGLALGGQFRRESIEQEIDQLNQGEIVGTGSARSTTGGRKSYGIYIENNIPVFSPMNSIPAFHALEFTAAGRFEYYLNNDTSTLVPKFGMRWQPLDESLTIRSTWGLGFLEPSLYELFGSDAPGFTGPDLDVPLIVSSNPQLKPEDSLNFTAGIVYTPKFVPGLTVTVDTYYIERNNVVFLPGFDDIIKRERTGTLLPGESVLRDPNDPNRILLVTETFQNRGAQRSRGVDFGLQYQRQTAYGTFTSLTQVTYLDSFRLADTESDAGIEVSNSGAGTADDVYLKWKGISRLDWAWKGFDIVATVHYTHGFHEILNVPPFTPFRDGLLEHWVHQTWFFDAQASYDLKFSVPVESHPVAGYSKSAEGSGDKDGKSIEPPQTASFSLPCWKNLLNHSSLTIGCNNVFGQDPPEAVRSPGFGFPSVLYDATGRFVYVKLTKRF